MLFRSKAFTFYNRFEKNDYKSVLYFNLAILEEQGLISKECTLILTGWIDKDSALYSLLRTYLDNITIPEIPMINQNREIKEDLKLHYYFDHIANILCAS